MQGQAFALLTLVGLVFAGCVGSGASSNEGGKTVEPLQPGQVDPDSSMGVVQGSVYNDEALPIQGAVVALRNSEYSTQTDANGNFQMINVMPGSYALDVARLGYEAASRKIDVAAGEISQVVFTLSAIEITEEAVREVLHFGGFFECALASNVWISSCSYPYTAVWGSAHDRGVNLSHYNVPPDIQKNTHRFNFTIRKDISEFVGELVWQSSSAAATRMLYMMLCGDYDYVYDECKGRIRYGPGNGVSGTSPVQSRIDGKEFISKGCTGTNQYCPKTKPAWVMSYIGLPFGNPQVAFQQRFDVWNSIFYYADPPEDYSLVRGDG